MKIDHVFPPGNYAHCAHCWETIEEGVGAFCGGCVKVDAHIKEWCIEINDDALEVFHAEGPFCATPDYADFD